MSSTSPTETEPGSTPQGDASQAPSGSFADLAIPDTVRQGLAALGYTAPTPVQRQCFGPALEGRDLVVQSKTGTGKTTAFCLPIAARLEAEPARTQALVLCPTRELALQVATEATVLFKPKGLEVVAVYGGASFGPQVAALHRGAAMVVGTPGRVMDQIQRGNLRLEDISVVVLDEADEMLSMGFWEDVTRIIDLVRHPHQTYLFSATLPEAIERAAKRYLKDPVRLHISGDTFSVEGIENYFYLVDDDLPKPRNFLWMMEVERPRSALVFCNTRGESEMVCHFLRRFGFDADVLNGDLGQNERERVMRKVKAGELSIMVATDVAARGIDISDLSHVFNYDLPEDPEIYIHRVGRTGRIGKRGVAVSLVRARYEATLSQLRRKFNVPMIAKTLPSAAEVLKMQSDRLTAQLMEEARDVEISAYRPVAEEMLKSGQAPELLAFLLRSYYAARKPAGAMDTGSAVQTLADRRTAQAERPARRDRGERMPERGPRPEHREHREPRAERPPQDAAPRPAPAVSPSAIYVGHGSANGVTEGELRAFLADKGGVAAEDIRSVRIEEAYTVVEVKAGLVDALVEKTNGQVFKELTLRVEPKRLPPRDKRRGDRPVRTEGAPAEGGERPRRRRSRGHGARDGAAEGATPPAGEPPAGPQGGGTEGGNTP